MVESAIDELNELRKEPERIIKYVEQNHDSPGVTWQESRVRRRRRMDDENAEDEPAETPEDDWKRNTFYVSVDTIINSLKSRFEKNQPLLQKFSLFAPSRFPQLVKNFKTAHDLQACLNTFCKFYNIDAFRCADKLFNFARSFKKFICSSVCQQEDDDDSGEDDDYDDDDSGEDDDYDDDDDDDADDNEDNGGDGDDDNCDDNYDDNYDDVDDDNDDEVSSTSGNEQSDNGTKKAKKQSKKKIPSFSDALLLLCNPDYSLVDAYPNLCRVYAIIAVAIPVSSSTAERLFSALKRVKTRIRSSMVQERLESLLSISWHKRAKFVL